VSLNFSLLTNHAHASQSSPPSTSHALWSMRDRLGANVRTSRRARGDPQSSNPACVWLLSRFSPRVISSELSRDSTRTHHQQLPVLPDGLPHFWQNVHSRLHHYKRCPVLAVMVVAILQLGWSPATKSADTSVTMCLVLSSSLRDSPSVDTACASPTNPIDSE